MRAQFCVAALWTAVLVPVLWALPVAAPAPAPQKGGGGITGPGSVPEGMVGESARAMTPFEQFADKLNLDEKTQVPQAAEIFKAAADQAAPFAVQMLQLRQKLLNAELSGQAADAKAVVDEYTAAAAKMSRIEADSFAKVYALLKPNQQSKAPQAFALMAGFFQSGPASRGRRGQP